MINKIRSSFNKVLAAMNLRWRIWPKMLFTIYDIPYVMQVRGNNVYVYSYVNGGIVFQRERRNSVWFVLKDTGDLDPLNPTSTTFHALTWEYDYYLREYGA